MIKTNPKEEKTNFVVIADIELFYDKIIQRLKQLFPNSSIHYSGLVLKIIDQLYNHIQTSKIDEFPFGSDKSGLNKSFILFPLGKPT